MCRRCWAALTRGSDDADTLTRAYPIYPHRPAPTTRSTRTHASQRDPKATLQGQFDGHLVAEAAPLLSGAGKQTDADASFSFDGGESGRGTVAST